VGPDVEWRKTVTARFDRGESNQLLVAALDAVGLPILVHDYDLIIFANSAAAEILGAGTGADIAGLSLDTFLVPELAGTTKQRRAFLLDSQVAFSDLPIKMRTLDGRTIHLRVDARPLAYQDSTIGVVTLAQ
jgi:PAS domain S-box-containing protein